MAAPDCPRRRRATPRSLDGLRRIGAGRGATPVCLRRGSGVRPACRSERTFFVTPQNRLAEVREELLPEASPNDTERFYWPIGRVLRGKKDFVVMVRGSGHAS